MLKVVKFGGSSLADAEGFKKVKDIIASDSARTAVVVSAPGKRFSGDNKVTDLLYLCHAHLQYGVDYSAMLDLIKQRFQEIAEGLGIDFDLESEFEDIDRAISLGAPQDYLVSRGEYLNAKIAAAHLDYKFVDSYGNIFFNYDKSIDKEKTYEALKLAYNSSGGRIVLPGFFGTMPGGELALMSRGGSDITGAILAAALTADVYENWTDVPGILMADPSIVKDPYPIPRISYDELRELTYMGAKVLHEASVQPVRELGIPVLIKNTQKPEAPGTLIRERFEDEEREDDKFYITGITGRKGFSVIEIHYPDLAQNIEIFREALKILGKYSLPIEQLSSSFDGFTLLIDSELVRPHIYSMIADLEELCGQGCTSVTERVSLIACVSRLMVYRSGISGSIFGALGDSDINIRTISQGASELNITIGVDDKDFEKAVQVLYDRFTKRS